MSPTPRKPVTTMEATVTSKGQVTLPSELRKRLGIQKGSRIRLACALHHRGPMADGRCGAEAHTRDEP
jgi:AbrB family looped-hinge helix DNA binding protein